ncbi:hypothetical protein ASG29_05335 [Sphingomonas sp. Leaf412]|uniref:hypothetical protein n=1 Tax=Sphingomonas sp. Leaf412 TaxID=1736370 RepID=UPI0006F9484F|nr:hypothetical protein [Sphingomonas sp. Leaf412]KQT33470.1 hypothetical protein ASG29_05335 [Sphingomonas sp. Leaf412]
MIKSIIGALVGREVGRRDGGGGAKGALVGMALTRVATRMGPLGMLLGGGYVAKKALDRRRDRKAGRVPPVI